MRVGEQPRSAVEPCKSWACHHGFNEALFTQKLSSGRTAASHSKHNVYCAHVRLLLLLVVLLLMELQTEL